MTTFDQILPITTEVLKNHRDVMDRVDWLRVNRDLNGRVRFIVPERVETEPELQQALFTVYQEVADRIAPHAYPVKSGLLYEASPEQASLGTPAFPLDEALSNIRVIDRLATDSRWESIAEVASGAPRLVFFSIKGGVGRSTALAASAWSLARQGRRVLVLDLDLESPGLSSALLPEDRLPEYGITDWLVEDLVDNGDALLEDMVATSPLQTPGSISLVPAHGRVFGEYVSKLGRVWMPKASGEVPESWPKRLNRLVKRLEERLHPDVILIDSRAGIDEVAAACVTDLGAHTVLLFAIQGQQTWTGYNALFSHWHQRGVITKIRERLQMVAGLVPDDERRLEYLAAFREDSYALFEKTYDQVAPGAVGEWSYDQDDDNAPHSPLQVRWNRGWYGLLSLQNRMAQIEEKEVKAVFEMVLDFVERAIGQESRL